MNTGPEAQLGGKDLAWILLGMLACIAAAVLLVGAFLLGVRVLAPEAWENAHPVAALRTTWGFVGIATVFYGLLLVCIHALGLRRRRLDWSALGFTMPNRGWLAAGMGTAAVFFAISFGIEHLTRFDATRYQANAFALNDVSWPAATGLLLAAGILAPIAEEAFFRGVLYGWLRRRLGLVLAVSISALVFGLVHVQPIHALIAAIMGVGLALLYEFSRSLWVPILTHVVNNLGSLVWVLVVLG